MTLVANHGFDLGATFTCEYCGLNKEVGVWVGYECSRCGYSNYSNGLIKDGPAVCDGICSRGWVNSRTCTIEVTGGCTNCNGKRYLQ